MWLLYHRDIEATWMLSAHKKHEHLYFFCGEMVLVFLFHVVKKKTNN